jgi:hypothetical protein
MEGDLEAVKDYNERGTTLGLGSMGAEVGEVEEGRGSGLTAAHGGQGGTL